MEMETDDSKSEGEVDKTEMFIVVNPIGVIYSLTRFFPFSSLFSVVIRTL